MTPLHAASVCTGIGGVDLGFFVRAGRVARVRVERAELRDNKSLCGFNVAWSFSRRAISTRTRALRCVYVIPRRGDPRARIGFSHVRVGVSECGP